MTEQMDHVRALYEDHGAALLRYFKSATGRPDVAEDLLQETFVQVMNGLHRLGQADSQRAWLFGIARHLSVNAVRRRRKVLPLTEAVACRSPAEEDPRREQVHKAIADLPEVQREALQLRLAGGLSYDQIARAMGVPVGTVRSRLHNAVKALRDNTRPCED